MAGQRTTPKQEWCDERREVHGATLLEALSTANTVLTIAHKRMSLEHFSVWLVNNGGATATVTLYYVPSGTAIGNGAEVAIGSLTLGTAAENATVEGDVTETANVIPEGAVVYYRQSGTLTSLAGTLHCVFSERIH